MKKIYEEQKNSTYKLQKKLGLDKTTLYRFINGKASIDNMTVKTYLEMCKLENQEPFELYEKIKKYLSR